jgi:hypothetical protein
MHSTAPRHSVAARPLGTVTRLLSTGACLLGLVVAASRPSVAEEPRPLPPADWTMRIESRLYASAGGEPQAKSLTLFRDGVAWDFLELPQPIPDGKPDATRMTLVEIVLHDPARERLVVIDTVRNVKTEVDKIKLDRLGVSLAAWARGTDDRLVRWAGGPDFEGSVVEKDGRIELVGPRVRYAIAHEPAPSDEAAEAYRQFADTAVLLKALLHPGGLPPFPRLALNRRIEAAGGIPTEVTLAIEPRFSPLPGHGQTLTSVHKMHPRMLATDLQRIEEAEGHLAAAVPVDLAVYANRHGASPVDVTPQVP